MATPQDHPTSASVRVRVYTDGCICETVTTNGVPHLAIARLGCPAHQDGPYTAVELDLDPEMSIDMYEPHPSVLTYGYEPAN